MYLTKKVFSSQNHHTFPLPKQHHFSMPTLVDAKTIIHAITYQGGVEREKYQSTTVMNGVSFLFALLSCRESKNDSMVFECGKLTLLPTHGQSPVNQLLKHEINWR